MKRKTDCRIDAAIAKPTLSNGVKVLMVFLGALSLPLLLPLAIIVIVFAVIYLIIIGVLIIIMAAIAPSIMALIIQLIINVSTGNAPLYLLVLSIGAALILLPLSYEAVRGLVFLVRKSIAWSACKIKRYLLKKGAKK
ncbi:MAG: hypothetical protein LBE03_01135 [Candidatus Nomurabacteria bacterium]|nr:hypothetical protein [Candidatus Nomurabacteria bacterium]